MLQIPYDDEYEISKRTLPSRCELTYTPTHTHTHTHTYTDTHLHTNTHKYTLMQMYDQDIVRCLNAWYYPFKHIPCTSNELDMGFRGGALSHPSCSERKLSARECLITKGVLTSFREYRTNGHSRDALQ